MIDDYTINKLHKIADETINYCVYKVVRHYWIEFNTPSYDLKIKSKRTIAQASLEDHHISLNPNMFMNNIDIFKTDIIPHEIAHLIAYRLLVKYTSNIFHGKEWRNIMRECFQLQPSAKYCIK